MKINASILSKKAKAPIFAYCRKLIKEGVNPKEPLEIYRTDPKTGKNYLDWDVRVSTIEEGAKTHVLENERVGPRFVNFKDWSPSTLPQKNNKLEEDVA